MGCKKLMTLAANQIAEQTTRMIKTTKSVVRAVHIVFCCQSVGYFIRSIPGCWCDSVGIDRAASHWIGFALAGSPLLIFVLALSILSASFLFCGSSAAAFCQASSACAALFSFM